MPRQSHKTPRNGTAGDATVEDLANNRHALNVLISERDWLRAQEAARADGEVSVSDIVRRALAAYLDSHPLASQFNEMAEIALQLELQLQQTRASLLAGNQERGG